MPREWATFRPIRSDLADRAALFQFPDRRTGRMISKSGDRFSDKIMRGKILEPNSDSTRTNQTLAAI
jgi:hypothetical protein